MVILWILSRLITICTYLTCKFIQYYHTTGLWLEDIKQTYSISLSKDRNTILFDYIFTTEHGKLGAVNILSRFDSKDKAGI